MKLIKADHHRNGVSGTGFDVAIFKHDGKKMLAVLFPEQGNCAVFDMALLAKDIIGFSTNSWRGDQFETELRPAVATEIEALWRAFNKSRFES